MVTNGNTPSLPMAARCPRAGACVCARTRVCTYACTHTVLPFSKEHAGRPRTLATAKTAAASPGADASPSAFPSRAQTTEGGGGAGCGVASELDPRWDSPGAARRGEWTGRHGIAHSRRRRCAATLASVEDLLSLNRWWFLRLSGPCEQDVGAQAPSVTCLRPSSETLVCFRLQLLRKAEGPPPPPPAASHLTRTEHF